ncbi:MAG: hypothetical protein KC501_39610, partial [Myxococcales bacterium]|nr:hypothetical protein [Myxococcales bacterium]
MRIVVFGATGLIGQGVLQQALADPEVEEVLVVVRRRIESSSPKLRQLVQARPQHEAQVGVRLGQRHARCRPLPAAGLAGRDHHAIGAH